jgi:hypothetical protein
VADVVVKVPCDSAGATREVARIGGNHETRRTLRFSPPLVTDVLELQLTRPGPNVPAALFEVRCYE